MSSVFARVRLTTEGSDMGRVVLLEYGRSASGRWFLIMLLDHIPSTLGVHGSPPTDGTLVKYTGGL